MSDAQIPSSMQAVLLTAHGGFEVLDHRDDVAVPTPGNGEVLIKAAAAGVNNTDINTRIGWYSKSVTSATDEGGDDGYSEVDTDDAGWSGEPLQLPRIQGADCCGRIVAVGAGVDEARIGQRVLVRTMQEVLGQRQRFHTITYGSEVDGGFADYAIARSSEAFAVESSWSDVELASMPCAYSTAEGLLHRLELGSERVLITGASGGVGSAAVQLAKRRGAEVVAVASQAKAESVLALGADLVIDRNADLITDVGHESIDAVVDLVAGPKWGQLPDVLRRGGRYATAGAIAGPLVELDVRTLYLKDLTMMGCTYQDRVVFENLVSYIENDEIRPVVAKTYALADIVEAQKDFLAKQFTGKLVLIP